jgi:2-polyprenyl-3-methyl-5-hydroxy-6-metoxy-1,4-benzoquinol methylase
MNDIATMLARAATINELPLADAERICMDVLKLDPANLIAHNALEHMQSAHCYSRWMRMNCVIDPRDDIFRFFVNHEMAKNPIREYLSDGWRTLSELILLLEQVEQPLLKTARVLEFAAGFGRFTRHLTKALPGRVTCTDIMPGSIDFLKEQFNVQGFESSDDPQQVLRDEKYELVFVLSMFTHLPISMWQPWLQSLRRLVQPGGLLVFSVHNEEVARDNGIIFDSLGTCFIASSESPTLDTKTYGTTYTTRQFVEESIENVFENKPLLYRECAFWRGQDAVVIRI